VFEHGACYGTCPHYRVDILSDHTVVWHGIADVKTIGVAHGRIDDRQLDKIRIALELASFDARDEFGTLHGATVTHCDDVPHIRITVTRRGVAHTIDHSLHCGPDDGLDQLETTLDEVAGTAAWK
jgi:hypothetical protein